MFRWALFRVEGIKHAHEFSNSASVMDRFPVAVTVLALIQTCLSSQTGPGEIFVNNGIVPIHRETGGCVLNGYDLGVLGV